MDPPRAPPVVEPCPGCRADGGALAGLPGLLCAAGARDPRDPRDRAAGAQEVPCLALLGPVGYIQPYITNIISHIYLQDWAICWVNVGKYSIH